MTNSLNKPSEDDIAEFSKIVANAQRLGADSRLLIESDRAFSAIMLAIFAIEELGKALIALWGVRNKKHSRPFPSHVEKQSASLALLAGVEISKMTKSQLSEIRNAGGGFHEMGPFSSQFAYARSGFFDDLRMAVTYADRQPKLPIEGAEEVGASMASELLDWFDLAFASVTNDLAMDVASTIFENDLGRM
ncbi:AbiV family abortive infection protein [Sphingopyxis sp. PET50]|uniref:AbiV family abortive infection protein n=1 Tax=Sphingopyxis sp. PET50 TaxID=2976533 RepID=UPI0021AED858|nr:AbiV family abortive infection protein [Sphingopyxis sp. PET50]